jgi:hypothetical protein
MVTDSNGKAKISLIVQDPNNMTIQIGAQGGIYGSGSASKDVTVKQPLQGTSNAQTGAGSMNVLGVNPLFIIIPVAAGVGGLFVLKKKNMLDGISEKISFLEKFSGITERFSRSKE